MEIVQVIEFVSGFILGFFALMLVTHFIKRLVKRGMGKNPPVQPTSEE